MSVRNLRLAQPWRAPDRAARACPSCGAAGPDVFYVQADVPAHSVLLMPTRQAAVGYAKGEIRLGFCRACGFITNLAVDPALHEYSGRYEETQDFSPTFTAFARRLAEGLIGRHGMRGKQILEIGCGKGEFLTLLCTLGGNRGIGFDPAYVAERNPAPPGLDITFVADFYSDRYAGIPADLVVCKMTLEHIADTLGFMRMVRRTIGGRPETVVFFQVPDATRILRDVAFWDVYYEHCSYFSLGSVARLFRLADFDVLGLRTDFDGQYLMIEARPMVGRPSSRPRPEEADLEALARDVAWFREEWPLRVDRWRHRLRQMKAAGHRPVIWGGGSKAVAFLTALGPDCGAVEYVVDVNPFKHRTYMAGTGQEIIGPDALREYDPDVVIVMNPIYREEIQGELDQMGLEAALLTV